ncbi:hypothetical protein [Hyphobacterium indicum]|uniref:hypothetical protein n=1 Tax=Hyphobacterium indicum TaxID=2162714 RepID=UPI000D642773|nr:hypothetical protein [Hyphobacterium indicum]
MRVLLALFFLMTGAAVAQAPDMGEGVVTRCIVDQAMLTEVALQITCDCGSFETPNLHDVMEIELDYENRRWRAERDESWMSEMSITKPRAGDLL